MFLLTLNILKTLNYTLNYIILIFNLKYKLIFLDLSNNKLLNYKLIILDVSNN